MPLKDNPITATAAIAKKKLLGTLLFSNLSKERVMSSIHSANIPVKRPKNTPTLGLIRYRPVNTMSRMINNSGIRFEIILQI